MRLGRRSAVSALLLALLPGCYGIRVSIQMPQRPAYKALSRPNLSYDDLDVRGLREAAQASLAYFDRVAKGSGYHSLGRDSYSREQVAASIHNFLRIIDETPPSRLNKRLSRECRSYSPRKGARYTAYYEPVLRASRRRDERFRYPVYAKPDELTLVRLSKFFPDDTRRIHGAVRDGELHPFLTREKIDGEGLLEGRGLELAWVDDPVALYFLHIQGSGRLKLRSGSLLRVNFAASNGLPYTSVGRYMLDKHIISSGSSGAIRSYLSANPEKRDEILFHNDRYIFFRKVKLADNQGPIGSLGVPLVAGRSIATDHRYVPPGALLYIKTKRPLVDDSGQLIGWRDVARFAFSHDSGAAIKGPGRADIYWGEGESAGAAAGYMNQPGKMLVLMCGEQPSRSHTASARGREFSRVAFSRAVGPERLAAATTVPEGWARR